MIEQLKTIRAGLETATCYSMLGVDAHSVQLALTALTQLEAMVGQPWLDERGYTLAPLHTAAPVAQQYEAGDMASAAAQGFRDGVASVTQQEPVAWMWKHKDGSIGFYRQDPATMGIKVDHPNYIWTKLYAAPVAQQPQARPDFADEWTGYLKDGETPFERFLRERKDLNALTKLYQRVLEENERLKGQQPQAECRSDGRCQYAIDSGAEGLGHCPKGKCVMKQSQAETAKVFHCKTCGCAMQMPHDDCLSCERGEAKQAEAVPQKPKLIGWRTSDYLMETSDKDKADNWSVHHEMLPIFEGDPYTKLVASTQQVQATHQHDLARRLRVHLANRHTLTGKEFADGVEATLAEYYAAPQQAEAAPPDAVRDAERWRMLPAYFYEYQIDAMKLYRDIDAAIAQQKGTTP